MLFAKLKMMTIVLTVGCVLSAGPALFWPGAEAQAPKDAAQEKKIEPARTTQFHAININGNGKIMIRFAGKEFVDAKGEVGEGDVKIENGVLMINGAGMVLVNAKELERIQINGSTETEVRGIDAKKLKITLGGASKLTIAGKVEEQDIEVQGSSTLHMAECLGKKGTVYVAGATLTVVNVSDHLKVKAEGSARAEYIGSPKIEDTIGPGARLAKHVAPVKQ